MEKFVILSNRKTLEAGVPVFYSKNNEWTCEFTKDSIIKTDSSVEEVLGLELSMDEVSIFNLNTDGLKRLYEHIKKIEEEANTQCKQIRKQTYSIEKMSEEIFCEKCACYMCRSQWRHCPTDRCRDCKIGSKQLYVEEFTKNNLKQACKSFNM